jgi:hypothetical protein
MGVSHIMARRQQAARVDGGIVRRAGYRKKTSIRLQGLQSAEMPLSATEADDE